MSKNFRRSAVALVLAATMVFGSQGFTAFADNGDNSGMPELLSVQTSGEGADDELTIGQSSEHIEEEKCSKTEGCLLPAGHEGECQLSNIPLLKAPKAEPKVTFAGYQMGGYYGGIPGAYEATRNASAPISDFLGLTFSFEDGLDREISPETGIVFDDDIYYGEYVTNPNDGRTWQCVGFVPYRNIYHYYPSDIEGIGKFVFTETPTVNDKHFQTGTLQDAIDTVVKSNGILYGEQATEENIEAFASTAEEWFGRNIYIMCVWYVSSVKEIEKGEYGDLSITPVNPVNYQPTSEGISFDCGDASYNYSTGSFEIDISISIDSPTESNLHINLNDILPEAMTKINGADGPNQVQPGDKMVYNISVQDNSGKGYQYVTNSVVIGTVPPTGEGNLGIGFEGYIITRPSQRYSYIPYRVYNDALETLGVNASDLTDEAVGKALQQHGYGSSPEDYADTTRQHLGHYYLDFLNQNRQTPATSFEQLTSQELSQLTNTQRANWELETCPDVAEAFYYFYYDRVYTFNGLSLYEQMTDSSSLETDFSQALANSLPFILTTKFDGNLANNGFQNTCFSFGMQFDISCPTPPSPDPDPTPDPDPDPDPTPRPDDDDDWEPLPDAPVKDKPEKVEVETEVPEETETPTTEQPDKYNPETGDTTTVFAAMALAAVSLGGVVLLGRKKK